MSDIDTFLSSSDAPAPRKTGEEKSQINDFLGEGGDGSLARGFKVAMRQIPQTIGGTIGLAGDAIGSDAVRDYGMDIYNKQSEKIKDLSRDSDSFTNVLQGDADPVEFLKYGTGYVGGQALTALATGGVGGFIGKKIAQRGIAGVVGEEAAKAAARRGAQVGAGTALGGSNFVQEAGSIYPEAVEQAQHDGRTLTGGDLARVAGAAVGAAAVDTAADALMLKGVAHGGSSASSIAKRAARTIPAGMAREGATEGVQTGIERWGAQQDLTSPDAIRDYVDSAALGAVGGGLGGAASAIQRRADTPSAAAAPVSQNTLAGAPLQLTHEPGTLVAFPDGTVGGRAEVDAYLAGLPEDQRAAARARLIGLGPQPADAAAGNPGTAAAPGATPEIVVPQPEAAPAGQQPLATVRPSEAMGLDPNAGPLSASAALAVDSGAHGQLQLAAQQQADVEASAEQQRLAAENRAAPPVLDYTDLSDHDKSLYDDYYRQLDRETEGHMLAAIDDGVPNFGDARNVTDEQFLRAMGATNQEIADALQVARGPAGPQESAGRVAAPAADVAQGPRPAATADAGQQGQAEPAQAVAAAPVPSAPAPASAPTSAQQEIARALRLRAEQAPAAPVVAAASGEVPAAKREKAIRRVQDGKAWFLSQEKADAFVNESGLRDTHQVVPDNRRFVVQSKPAETAAATSSDIAKPAAVPSSEWAAFSNDSGTKGVPRAEMPQIKAEHRGAMTNFMNARGIAHAEETVPAESLKPTQAEFSPARVQQAKEFQGGDRAILVSRDGHVLDGHHQWLAARERGGDVRVIRLDAPIEELLTAAHEFPSSTTDRASEGASAPPGAKASAAGASAPGGTSGSSNAPVKPARGVVAKVREAKAKRELKADRIAREAEDARATYFKPGNVVRSYGQGFDQVISYKPADKDGNWSVTVRAVRKIGAAKFEPIPNERERTHSTQPSERELRVGPAPSVSASPRAVAAEERAPAAQALAQEVKAPAAAPAPAATPDSGKIVDFGEKIGGARKDRAEKTGARAPAEPKDSRPAWARRFEVSQIAKSRNANEEGRWVIRDARSLDSFKQPRQVGRDSYATREEAEAAIPLAAVALKHRVTYTRDGKFEIWRDVTDRKRVKVVEQSFDTREDALRYMAENAQRIIETNTTFGEADLPRPAGEQRVGPARREGDVKDNDFTSTFGFRGVEFGNWNNQSDRQQLLNDAYDGLLDLADVMGIPPRAISLNGELALAFGARGSGLSGARAHYEPAKAVINLTKMNGAGSLAHEWFHAMDHYFGRQDGKAPTEWVTEKDGTRSLKINNDFERNAASGGTRGERSGMRAEVQEAYRNVMNTMMRKAEQYTEDTAKADQFVGASRKDVEDRLAGIRKYLAEKLPDYFKRNNKPATAEQLAEFDTLAEQIVNGEALELRIQSKSPSAAARLSGYRWTNDVLEKMSAILKAVRGQAGFSADQKGTLDALRGDMQRYSQRLKMLADAQQSTEKTRSVPTSFAMDARELDQGRGQDYWTSPHEMAARAFQGYVEDKIAERGSASPFLNYGPEDAGIMTPWGVKRPFPHGAERTAINQALDKLVSVIQTRESDDGNVALFSRSADTRAAFDARIDALFAGDHATSGTRILDSSDVMGLLGYPKVPMMLNESHLREGMTNHPEMTAAAWKKVPDWLENPAAVYRDGKSDRLIVIAPDAVAGYPVFLVVEPNPTPAKRGHSDPFQLLVTAYAKTTGGLPAPGYLATSGQLLYVDTKNAPEVWQRAGGQFPGQAALRGRQKILTEKQLGGYRRANGAAFSLGEGGGMSVAEARRMADGIRRAWANGPEVVVVQNMQDPAIPERVRQHDAEQKSQGAEGEPEGFFYGGKAYIVAGQLTSQQDVARVLMHEALGHYGLRGVFGKALEPILQRVATLRQAEVRAKAEQYGLDFDNPAHRLNAAEEVLAEMAQADPKLGLVQSAIAAIRNWLRGHVPGFGQLALTDADIVQGYLAPARQFVEGSAALQAVPNPLPAYSRPKSRDSSAFSPAARMQAVQSVERTTDGIRKAWANGPQVVVAFDMGDPVIPEAARRADLKQRSGGARGAPEGFYYRGKVYLMASRLNTPADAARVLFHEALGHHGLRGVFGKELNGILNQIATMRRSDVDAKVKEYGLRGVNKLDRRAAAEEVLAEMAQDTPEVHFVRRAVAAIRTWLRHNVPGLRNLRMTDDEIIRNYILPARRFVEQGGPDGGGPRAGDAAFNRADGAEPMFSRSKVAEYARTATAELNKTFSAPGKVSWWHKTVGTMYNLAERSPAFKPVFQAAQGFVDDVSHFATDASELAPRLLPKLETWRDITKSPITAADNKALARPVFEGTLSWARDESGKPVPVQNLIDAAAGMTVDQKAQRLLRNNQIDAAMLSAWKGMPLESYEKAINSRYESRMLQPGVVWSDAELQSMFGLTDPQASLYKEFRAATDRSLDTMARADMLRFAGEDAKAIRDQVMDADDAQVAALMIRDHLIDLSNQHPDRATQLLNAANGIIDRADKVAELQGRGYAPLSRFGQYTVDVVANGERQYFGLFETAREANEMAAKMRTEFGDAAVSQGTLSNEAFKLFAGVTPESLELFGNMLGLDSTGDSAQDHAFQEYLRLTKTNRSAMRRLIHRQGIAGYSEDVGRVLASFIYSNSRQTAAGLHMGDLGDAVNAIPKEQGELKDVAVRLAEYVKNPQEEAQAVRGLLFAQYLGGSIASAFVNMTQPVAVTFPWLSQYGGARKAASALTTAAKQMATKGFSYEADLAKALKDAEDDGTVSPQEVHQLMAQARGSGSLQSGDGTRLGDARAAGQNALSRLSLAWGKVFGAAEQVNRRVTFIAAFRIARERGMEDPAGFAKQAVTETQFLYSKANKMHWARGAVGGTLMTFKTYSVAYLELLHRMYTQGGPEGKKAALLALGMLMVMGGAGGLPFAEDLEDVADALAQMLGYNFSAKKARQEVLEAMLPKGIANFLDKGISGLPGAPLDVSGRLGMGNLIPGTGLLQEKTSHTRDVLEIAGPAGDFASRILSGGRNLLTGDIGAGLLEMSPTAVRNAAKGVDMATTGMYRDAKGYKVLDTNLLEAALKGIGFQPQSVATIQEANGINQRAKGFYNLRAQEIRAQWAAGIFEKDDDKVQRARAAVADWNAKNPEQPMVVRVPDIMKLVREMSKPKDQRIADTAPKAMRAQMREELARTRAELAG